MPRGTESRPFREASLAVRQREYRRVEAAKILETLRRHAVLAATSAAFLLAVAHFFERFPNGWDQAEYAWCVQSGYLPHSPYILFILAGRLIHLILDPATALSLLSTLSGLVSILLYYHIQLRLFSTGLDRDESPSLGRAVAAGSSLLMGLSYVFIRQASSQEVYVFQTLLLFLSISLLLAPVKHGAACSGAAYGCALAAHNASLFLLPAVVYAVLCLHRQGAPLPAPAAPAIGSSAGPFPEGRNGPARLSSKEPHSRSGIGGWEGLASQAPPPNRLQREPRRFFRDSPVRSLAVWLLAAAAACGAFCLLLYLVLPVSEQGSRLSGLLVYLRGISSSLPSESWSAGRFWTESVRGLFRRLTSLSVPASRDPLATSPLGLSTIHLLASGLGLIMMILLRTRQGLFWLLYLAPYTLYELLLGMNLDYGIYLPMVLPSLWSFIAFAVFATAKARSQGRRISPANVLRSTVLLSFLAPSAFLLARHWSDPERDAVAHFSPSTLAAIWMSRNLPPDALVIQASEEGNVNLLPYYARRQHVLRNGPFMLFRDRGEFTPMNRRSYEPLTTALLRSTIDSGRPVYGFEKDPLLAGASDLLDPGAFAWEVGAVADLDSVKAALPVSETVRRRLARGMIPLYRARLR